MYYIPYYITYSVYGLVMIVYIYTVNSINHQYDLDIMTHPPTQFKHYTALRNSKNINKILRYTLFYIFFKYSLRPFGPPLIAGPRCRLFKSLRPFGPPLAPAHGAGF